MPYQCTQQPENNDLHIKLLTVVQGVRCPLCWKEKNSGNTSPAWRGRVTEVTKFSRLQLTDWKLKLL